MNSKNKICIVGWHYFKKLYKSLLPTRDCVHVISHRHNDILDRGKFNYSKTDNIGLDFGAYDWYIKNVWDKESDVIFMHDDILINTHFDLSNIFKKCQDGKIDQGYILGDKRIKKIFGPHSRMFFLSRRTIQYFLNDYSGFWYKNEIDNSNGDFPSYLMNYLNFEWNEKIYSSLLLFNDRLIRLSIKYDLITRHIVCENGIRLYRRGKTEIKAKSISIKKKKRSDYLDYRYTESKKTIKKYKKYLFNKRVVLVGSAFYLTELYQEDVINSYDVVVRLNRGYITPPKMQRNIGSRTDILYSSLADVTSNGTSGTGKYFDFNFLIKNTKWISGVSFINLYRILTFKKNFLPKNLKLYISDQNLMKFMSKIIGRPLTTGFGTICDLLSHDIKELYVTGFDFYNPKDNNKFSYPGYKPYSAEKNIHDKVKNMRGKWHNPQLEFEYFKERFYKNDDRVKCDKILDKKCCE